MGACACKGCLIGYDNAHGRIYFVYFPDTGETVRVNAVKFHEEIPEKPSPDEDPSVDYEAVFDDPGLTNEFMPASKLRSDPQPVENDEDPTPMPTTAITKEDDSPETVTLPPTPESTPEPASPHNEDLYNIPEDVNKDTEEQEPSDKEHEVSFMDNTIQPLT